MTLVCKICLIVVSKSDKAQIVISILYGISFNNKTYRYWLSVSMEHSGNKE